MHTIACTIGLTYLNINVSRQAETQKREEKEREKRPCVSYTSEADNTCVVHSNKKENTRPERKERKKDVCVRVCVCV